MNPETQQFNRNESAEEKEWAPTIGEISTYLNFKIDVATDNIAEAKTDFQKKSPEKTRKKFEKMALIITGASEKASNLDDLVSELEKRRRDLNASVDNQDMTDAITETLEQIEWLKLSRSVFKSKPFEQWQEEKREEQRQEQLIEAQATSESNEQELNEIRLMMDIMATGGSAIHTSLPAKYHPKGSAGFTDLVDQKVQGDKAHHSLSFGGDVKDYFGLNDRNMGSNLAQAKVCELVGVKPMVEDVYENVDTEMTVKRLGGLLGSKRVVGKEKKVVGTKEVSHNEVVKGGENEPAVKLMYYVYDFNADPDKGAYKDYSNRHGNLLAMELILPNSVAERVTAEMKDNPSFVRKIAGEIVTKKLGIPEDAWGKGDEFTKSPVKPPYEEWDKHYGKMYIKEPGDSTWEFNPERIVSI